MAVLIVLLGSLLLLRGAGALGFEPLDSWVVAARWALAIMLLFTATAHFNRLRHDMVRMLPPWVRWPRQVVAFTGVCEVLGAIGILIPSTRRIAGILLVLFFISILPANVHAARSRVSIGSRPATPLGLRIPMQLLFIGMTWWVTRPAG